jgi:signal transduction histidine kinase
LLAIASHPTVARDVDRAQALTGIALALVVLSLVLHRVHALRGPARRAQGPLLGAAAITAVAGLVWLGRVIAIDARASTFETIGRAVTVTIPLGIVAGIGWSRLRHPRASDLVVELRSEAPATMRERLARALDDPTLEVAYRLDEGRYVDAAGRPIELPERADRARAVTAVTAAGEEVAALIHDPALLDEPALVESVRATAALVLENERLAAAVRSQLAEVRASRGRIVAAADAERRRIERNLHDGAQQRLVTLSVALGLEASRADASAADVLSRAQDEVEQAIAELRELARGIHPTLLRDEGLHAAVEALARRAPLPVTVQSTVRDRLPDPVELAAYFVVAEALTNVVKHASASEASVLLEQEPVTLRATVTDDGVGGARITPDSGLAGLRDRLEALDATLSIKSEADQGTTVCAEIPCGS